MIAILTTSPRIRSLLYLIRALFAEMCHPNFIEICMGRHVGAHPDEHQHGGRKPTETSVTELVKKA